MGENNIYFISPNKLKIWLECPRKFWHYYINEPTRYKEPPRAYYSLGEAVHDTLNSFFSLVPQIRTEERLFDQFELHWQSVKNQEGGFKDSEEELGYKQRAVQMLENFYKREDVKVVPYKLSPTRTKYIPLTDGIMLGGKIDRVDLEPDGDLHIIDYKTGREDRDDPYQLPIYDLLVRSWLKKNVSKLSYLHLESGNWSTKNPTDKQREETKKLIIDVVKDIPKTSDKSLFLCDLGEKCSHCDYLRELGIKPVLN
ncbi:MAG: PD-(D/E)XK nuclease family protein [Candidatus Woykebacteria bacterium]